MPDKACRFRLLTNPWRGMGRSADLPIKNQTWRHVRQNCIFQQQSRHCQRQARPARAGIRRICAALPALPQSGAAPVREEETLAFLEKNEYLPVRKLVCAVREFPRSSCSLKNHSFSTNCFCLHFKTIPGAMSTDGGTLFIDCFTF